MPTKVRLDVIARAKQCGFTAELKQDGEDIHEKLISLSSIRCPSKIYIDKITGISRSGNVNYFKVAVHPEHYREDLENILNGVMPALNQLTKQNRHSHSGYRGFPYIEDNNEPIAKAYRVDNLDALNYLLQGLSSECDISTAPVLESVKSQGKSVSSKAGLQFINMEQLPTKALIIKEPWIDLILSGQKTWEMRSSSCKIRGWISLIRKGSGHVVGTAKLVDCIGPLTAENLCEASEHHCITKNLLPDSGWMEKWCYAWVLESASYLENPVPYKHPAGAVIWVNLPEINTSLKI